MKQRAAMFLLVAGLIACNKKQHDRDIAGTEVAPLLALPTADGGTFDPGSLSGKRVLVNFWAPG
jgi:hypothetical protein